MTTKYKAIDLFAGCGGLSCGFEKAGFTIDTAVEFDPMIANSYKCNHPQTHVISDDICNVDNSNVFSKGFADVIIGGPPCQGFSMAGSRIRKSFDLDDPRNYLFKHYFNIVKIVQPKIFVIENVKGILTLHHGETFKSIINLFSNSENFDGLAYNIQYKILKASDYGIPQARERVIIIGSQYKFDIDDEIARASDVILRQYPTFFDIVTVSDAISNLPSPTFDGIVKITEYKTDYQKYLSGPSVVHNHNATRHSVKAQERMNKIGIDQNYEILNETIRSVHSGSYGRLNPNSVAQTITTRFDTPSGGKFIHPYEDRTITPREAARLQSFPDSFIFFGTKTNICKQIGNAVPPKLAYVVATAIRGILDENI